MWNAGNKSNPVNDCRCDAFLLPLLHSTTMTINLPCVRGMIALPRRDIIIIILPDQADSLNFPGIRNWQFVFVGREDKFNASVCGKFCC